MVALEAARIMLFEGVGEYYDAKHIAAERLTGGRVDGLALPSNRQIRAAIVVLTSVDREPRRRHLRRLRRVAVDVMEALAAFEPRLIGSVASGAVHAGSDVDLHVFCRSEVELESALSLAGYDAERFERPVLRGKQLWRYVHYRFERDGVPVELSVYEPEELRRVSYSSIDGKPIDRVPLQRVRRLLAH